MPRALSASRNSLTPGEGVKASALPPPARIARISRPVYLEVDAPGLLDRAGRTVLLEAVSEVLGDAVAGDEGRVGRLQLEAGVA